MIILSLSMYSYSELALSGEPALIRQQLPLVSGHVQNRPSLRFPLEGVTKPCMTVCRSVQGEVGESSVNVPKANDSQIYHDLRDLASDEILAYQ